MALETGISNVSQILDVYWVGRLGSAALAALTISITFRWVMNSLANGLGIGGLAVVARRIGEKNEEAADHATWQAILLGLAASALLSALGLTLASPLLRLMGADDQVLPLGLSFMRVAFGGQFTLILVWVINSLLRGAGEARLAMSVLFLTTAVTVVLEPLLIFGIGPIPTLGLAGSAWANVLGYGVGLLLQCIVLLRGRARIRINLRDLRPDFPLMWHILKIAFPSTIQMVLRSSSRLVILAMVGLFGTFATAGYGVAGRVLLLALIPGFGLGNAAGTLVGQNLGARQPDRAEKTAWWVVAYNIAVVGSVAALATGFAQPISAIFDRTPEVVAVSTQVLHIVAPTLVASAAGVVLGRSFDGAGNTMPAMAINLLSLWVLEVPLAYVLSQWTPLGLSGIFWGRAIANVANGLIFALWFRRGRWKARKV